MAPAKTAARSRRTYSYSWSTDSSMLRPVRQWPDLERTSSGRTSVDDQSDGASDYETQHRTSASDSNDASDAGSENVLNSRPLEGSRLQRKVNYDSDSCLTPRSKRTLRRTLSGDTEPWPSVKAPAKPVLDTIYSPSHEILHPMQSLLLEKSLSNAEEKPLGNTLVLGRRTVSEDFVSRRRFNPTSKMARSNSDLKFETYAFSGRQLREEDESSESTLKTAEDEYENESTPSTKAKNVVVIIVDAEKRLSKLTALDWAINVAVQPGDEIVVLGVLKHVHSPMGYKLVANTDPLVGVHPEILQSEVKKTTEAFEQKLTDNGRQSECEKKNVKLTVRIAPGARARTVVVRELAALKATYAIFDRKQVRARRYYGKHLSCHAVRMRSNGRSIKTIFAMTANSPQKMAVTVYSPSTASSSPTSETSPSPSPTYFWRRFAHFRSSRNSSRSSTASPEANVSPKDPATVKRSVNLDSFVSDLQDFSVSLDQPKDFDSLGKDSEMMLTLPSCVDEDVYSQKPGIYSHRIKQRPTPVSIPPICAS